MRSGKGRKERIVYCPAGGREAIDAWIARRGLWSGALLKLVTKGGRIQHRANTAEAVLLRLRYLADQAGVTRFSPHDLRRSFVGELLDAGADINSVQQLAGHANLATTQRYDRRPKETKRRTAEMLHVPYVAPVLLVSANPAEQRTATQPDPDAQSVDPEPADSSPVGPSTDDPGCPKEREKIACRLAYAGRA